MFVYFRGDTLTGGGGNIKAFPHNHKSPESCSGSSGRVHEEVSKTAPNLFLQICSNRKVNNLTEIRHASIALSFSVLSIFKEGKIFTAGCCIQSQVWKTAFTNRELKFMNREQWWSRILRGLENKCEDSYDSFICTNFPDPSSHSLKEQGNKSIKLEFSKDILGLRWRQPSEIQGVTTNIYVEETKLSRTGNSLMYPNKSAKGIP